MSTVRQDSEYLAAYDATREQFAAIIDGSAASDPVPTCPGWSVRDLVDHLGGVHAWAENLVRGGEPSYQRPVAPHDDATLAGWYQAAAESLATALRETPRETPAWSFGADRTVAFWIRRQAHETAMHLIDAQAARGTVAADAVSEVFDVMLPRMVKGSDAGAPITAPILLRAVDTGDTWLLRPAASLGTVDYAHGVDGRDAVAEVEASASDLALRLWGRAPHEPWQVTGDESAVAALLSRPLTP